MIRRAMFQFGALLPKGPRGQVDAGLGKVTSRGTVTLIPPTQVIREPIEVHTIDGVEMIFQLTPDTEAPAEMHMFYPGLRALNLAENATHNLHNIYPIRGAQVRDANAWAKYLNEARDRFAPKADVVFAQHHWPVWGNSRVLDYLAKQRDTYKYLHDQTLRLMNHGLKAAEIAERVALPKSLEKEWHVRGYYGTFSHNAKSVYQRYLGWYDANPANLNPLPPVERAKKTVAYMGGAEAAIARAREDFANGEYRWVADAMSQIVFAEPENRAARELGADALEQLGYQSESATWRNAYLQGARELRGGLSGAGRPLARGHRHRARPLARPVLRLPRRAPQRAERRRQDHRHQLGVSRHRPALCPHPAELRAHLPGRPPRARARLHRHARPHHPQPRHPARADAPRSAGPGPRQDRRQRPKGRRALRPPRRFQHGLRGRGAVAEGPPLPA